MNGMAFGNKDQNHCDYHDHVGLYIRFSGFVSLPRVAEFFED